MKINRLYFLILFQLSLPDLSMGSSLDSKKEIIHWDRRGYCVFEDKVLEPSACNHNQPFYLFDGSYGGSQKCNEVILDNSVNNRPIYKFKVAADYECKSTRPLYYSSGTLFCSFEDPVKANKERGNYGGASRSHCPNYYYFAGSECLESANKDSKFDSIATTVEKFYCEYSIVLKLQRNCYYFRVIGIENTPITFNNLFNVKLPRPSLLYEVNRIHDDFCQKDSPKKSGEESPMKSQPNSNRNSIKKDDLKTQQ